jgi:hypothetical protein
MAAKRGNLREKTLPEIGSAEVSRRNCDKQIMYRIVQTNQQAETYNARNLCVKEITLSSGAGGGNKPAPFLHLVPEGFHL